MSSSITTAQAANFALLTDGSVAADRRKAALNKHNGKSSYDVQLGTFLESVADSLTALDIAVDATVGVPSAWSTPVASLTLLKAVVAGSRADKQARVVEDNGQGGESIYVYDLESTADADEPNVVLPDDSTGRWILSMQGGASTVPVRAGEAISKGESCYISGWNATDKRLVVMKADSTNPAKAAYGVAAVNIGNGAKGILLRHESTITGIDTSTAASVGTLVYFSAAGAPVYTPPTSNAQSIGVVSVKNASGSIRVTVQPPVAPSAASTTVPGLQSAADKTKQNNTLLSITGALSALDMAGGGGPVTKDRAMGFAPAAGTVTAIKWLVEGTASVDPAANPNDLVVEVYKGLVLIGNKTYVGAVPPATWDALTLSVVPGATTVAADDPISIKVTQNGTCDMDASAVFQVVISPAAV